MDHSKLSESMRWTLRLLNDGREWSSRDMGEAGIRLGTVRALQGRGLVTLDPWWGCVITDDGLERSREEEL